MLNLQPFWKQDYHNLSFYETKNIKQSASMKQSMQNYEPIWNETCQTGIL